MNRSTNISGATSLLLAAAALCLPFPADAVTYYSRADSLQVNSPTRACRLKPFTYRLQRYGQVFEGAVYPVLTLTPCSQYEPVAHLRGVFRVYKVTADHKEGCTGDVAIKFSRRGRQLDLVFVNRGSLPDTYCRDRRKTLEYRLYRR